MWEWLVVSSLLWVVSVADPYFPGHNQGGCNADVSLDENTPPSEVFLDQQRVRHCYDSNAHCHDLPAVCLDCTVLTSEGKPLQEGEPPSCHYGEMVDAECTPAKETRCAFYGDSHNKKILRKVPCNYCFQSDPREYTCSSCNQCLSIDTPRQRYMANCTVNYDTFCEGSRTFYMMKLCGFTTGYKWSTAFILSLTLGGFGVDRFYLGFWKEGLGKLFSFGGLGVWTMVDAILIGVGYITPADGSLYM